ncbi:MAG: urate hydroxylase PuuD [Caulobacteraceae bacterium]
MAGILLNLRNTIILGVILAIIMMFAYSQVSPHGLDDTTFWQAVFRWMHVVFGILWIGLLYYFNFVQTRKMPEIPAEQKPAITKFIAPEAMFWFRWSALFTVLAGIGVAILRGNGYAEKVFSFGFADGDVGPDRRGAALMGIGVWLGILMFLNVWGIIWPNQKIVLGMKEADADAKAKAGRIATLASRANVLMSLPMLTSMAMYQTLYG